MTDFFVVVDVFLQDNKEYHLFLDEKNHPPHPSEYKSKGFTDAKVVQDFPLRGKPVFLHIRRRKWQHETVAKRSRDAKQTIDYVLPQG